VAWADNPNKIAENHQRHSEKLIEAWRLAFPHSMNTASPVAPDLFIM
jgi:hypothetical protein